MTTVADRCLALQDSDFVSSWSGKVGDLKPLETTGMRDGRRDISTRLIPGPVWAALLGH